MEPVWTCPMARRRSTSKEGDGPILQPRKREKRETKDDFASRVMGRSKESIKERTQLEGVQ
jgi:hypothetical protein